MLNYSSGVRQLTPEEGLREIYSQIWKTADTIAQGAEQQDKNRVDVFAGLLMEQVQALDRITRRKAREEHGAGNNV